LGKLQRGDEWGERKVGTRPGPGGGGGYTRDEEQSKKKDTNMLTQTGKGESKKKAQASRFTIKNTFLCFFENEKKRERRKGRETVPPSSERDL